MKRQILFQTNFVTFLETKGFLVWFLALVPVLSFHVLPVYVWVFSLVTPTFSHWPKTCMLGKACRPDVIWFHQKSADYGNPP